MSQDAQFSVPLSELVNNKPTPDGTGSLSACRRGGIQSAAILRAMQRRTAASRRAERRRSRCSAAHTNMGGLEEASSTRACTVTHTFTRPFSSRMWWGRHSLSWEGRREGRERGREGGKKCRSRCRERDTMLVNIKRLRRMCESFQGLVCCFM